MSKRLNVLFVTPWYPTHDRPYWGIFVREHARAVVQYNNVVVLHTIGRSPSATVPYALAREVDTEISQGIPTYTFCHRSPLPRTDRLVRNWSLFRALQEVCEEQGYPDVIHAHTHRVALMAVLFGKINKIPVVVSEQHSAFPLRTLTYFERLEAKWALRQANALLPVSVALQRAIAAYGIERPVEIVPNVVDTDQFKLKGSTAPAAGPTAPQPKEHQKIKLLCVANMPESEVKGYPYLFQALANLCADLHWDLTVIGDGPLQPKYEQMVQELGLSNRVHFLGYQPKPAIVQAMQESDLFVLASVWDNMPCVLIEAMATGLPIVATNVGGIPEVVTPEVGRLAEPANAASLQSAIAEMINSRHEYQPTRLNTLAQQYSMVSVGQQLDQIYRKQLNSTTIPASVQGHNNVTS